MLIIDGKPVSPADAAWEMAKREVERVMPKPDWQARAEAAEARVKALEEALRPFARAATQFNEHEPPHDMNGIYNHPYRLEKSGLVVSDLRRASETLKR